MLFILLIGIGISLYIIPTAILCQFRGVWTLYAIISVIYLLYGLFMPEINAYFTVKRFKKDTAGEGKYKVVFGDTIEVWQGKIRVCWEYAEINQVRHLKYSYELMKNKRMAIMVDPIGFTKGTFPGFKQFLREKRPDLNIPE